MSSKKNEYHDKGEKDRAEGKEYQRPHGLLEDLMGVVDGSIGSLEEDNRAYRQGWDNADKQDKDKK